MSTTLSDIERLMAEYQTWLKDKTRLRDVTDEWVEITTPYLDRHNDAIQIFAKRDNGTYLLTDDGYIVRDLESSGCSINTEKRRELLQTTLNGFGVKLHGDALEVRTSSENFPRGKHNLVQSMLAINDLFYLAKPIVESLFFEDVESWLNANGIRFLPKVKLAGTSGYDHLFHFVIPKSRKEPERIVQAINRPSKDTAQSFIHEWTDTQKARSAESKAFALLNDEQVISPSVLEAFRAYAIHPVPWTNRLDVIEELAA